MIKIFLFNAYIYYCISKHTLNDPFPCCVSHKLYQNSANLPNATHLTKNNKRCMCNNSILIIFALKSDLVLARMLWRKGSVIILPSSHSTENDLHKLSAISSLPPRASDDGRPLFGLENEPPGVPSHVDVLPQQKMSIVGISWSGRFVSRAIASTHEPSIPRPGWT